MPFAHITPRGYVLPPSLIRARWFMLPCLVLALVLRIELYNPTHSAITLTGMILVDSKGASDSDALTLGQGSCPTSLPANEYAIFCRNGAATVGTAGSSPTTTPSCGFAFGLGGADTAQLFDANSKLIHTSGSAPDLQSATKTYGCENGKNPDTFYLMSPTPLAANPAANPASPPTPPAPPPYFLASNHPDFISVLISEVADKGDDTDICAGEDWIELFNPTANNEALTGIVLVDDKGHGHTDRLVLGAAGCPQILNAGKYMVLCKAGKAYIDGTAYEPTGSGTCGFSFGVGSGDTLNLFLNATHEHYLDNTPGCCAGDETKSYGLTTLDGTGTHSILPVRTPGVQNIWTVMINEVASTGNAADACAGEGKMPASARLSLLAHAFCHAHEPHLRCPDLSLPHDPTQTTSSCTIQPTLR